MTTLDDLQNFIDAAEAQARDQDETIGACLAHLAELAPNTVIGVRADALPDVRCRPETPPVPRGVPLLRV